MLNPNQKWQKDEPEPAAPSSCFHPPKPTVYLRLLRGSVTFTLHPPPQTSAASEPCMSAARLETSTCSGDTAAGINLGRIPKHNKGAWELHSLYNMKWQREIVFGVFVAVWTIGSASGAVCRRWRAATRAWTGRRRKRRWRVYLCEAWAQSWACITTA